jgi:hypothetical protein
MYQNQWNNEVKKFIAQSPEVEKLAEDENKGEELIELLNAQLLNRPEYYFNEDNLSQSHRVVASVRDFFLHALGKKSLPKREEQIGEWRQGLLDKYGRVEGAGSQKRLLMIRLIVDEVIKDEELRNGLYQKPGINFLLQAPFNQGYTAEEWINTFGKDNLLEMVADVRNSRILKI